MIVVIMKNGASAESIRAVVDLVESKGYHPNVTTNDDQVAVSFGSACSNGLAEQLQAMPDVEKTFTNDASYRLVSRIMHPEPTIVACGAVPVGTSHIVIIAGPCSVESESQIIETALAVKEAGAHILRGGAYKPRTSPYSFQGLGEPALEMLARARERSGLPFVTEVVSIQHLDIVQRYADMIQIGTRNAQNYPLLQAAGLFNKPVLLKRGLMMTVNEFLMSAEHILAQGNGRVILCERGIRTFEPLTRSTLDISAVPILKQLTHLPVMVDPSHAAGKHALIPPLAKAAVAAGVDGIMIETHAHPHLALSDGPQSLRPEILFRLITDLRAVAQAVGRTLN